MDQGLAEAERERELSKQALAERVSILGTRVRSQLDWRAKLRRNGGRYAVIGTVTVAIAVSVIVLRSRSRRQESDQVTVTSLDDIAAQLQEIKDELAKRRKESGPLWQKLALRAAATAASAGGSMMARRAMERMTGGEPGRPSFGSSD